MLLCGAGRIFGNGVAGEVGGSSGGVECETVAVDRPGVGVAGGSDEAGDVSWNEVRLKGRG